MSLDVFNKDTLFSRMSTNDYFIKVIYNRLKPDFDYNENIQFLCGIKGNQCNNIKSNSITEKDFNSIDQVKYEMICERYWDILHQAKQENWSIELFDQKMQISVDEFLRYKARMSYEELKNYFDTEVKRWNRNINVPRAVIKFRKFSEKRKLDS